MRYPLVWSSVCCWLLVLASCAPSPTSLETPQKPSAGLTEIRRLELPDTPLRGYGSLGGRYLEFGTPREKTVGSVLQIRCADAGKAEITLGKFRTDLRCLGGVTDMNVTLGGKEFPVAAVPGQGAILALRQGTDVIVVAAPQTEDLGALLATCKLGKRTGLDFTGAAVPTYLDKIDRWGFGFWCNPPLLTPENQEETYDLREKFAWAQRMKVGLQIDTPLNQNVSAAGLLDDNGKRWAIEAARDLGIPVFIQMQGAPAPGWIASRYGSQMQQKVPQYIGSWYGINGNSGFAGSPLNTLSWAAVEAKDQLLADQYQAVRKYKSQPNVTGYGEWHGEVGEGTLALFMDYGPTADARYRTYLRERYQTPAAIDQRWHGGQGVVKSWDDICMPEPAEFLGWGKQAVDLQGEWRVCLEEKLPADAKDHWGDAALKDEGWRKVVAPGDDHQLIHEKWRAPAIFRRAFTLSADQMTRLKSSGKTYLYAWTLEGANNTSVRASINGQRLPDQPATGWASWVVFEVTDSLHVGNNLLALSLPWGEISYRIYLSPDAPRCYPDLGGGGGKNAQWVDYRDFITWLRDDGLRRSIEAIRRADPDKFIKIYAPGAITDVMKGLAEDYGCYFHDTGGMSGNWDDSLPALMRSSGMPMSLEPGNAAQDLPNLKQYFGHWLTEGLNTVDYFMDIGDILWRPDQKAWFEAHQPLVHLLGKCHYPEAQVAVLSGARAHRLTDFPWDHFDTPLLWNTRRMGVGTFNRTPNPRDLINESDFARGTVNKYQVIIDDATLVMDEALITQIETWVRAGGIFITQGQTGRHTPEKPDAWPINRLTGYRAIGNNDNWRVGAIAGQPIFTDPIWTQTEGEGLPVVGGSGLFLEKVAPECQDILAWPNKAGIAMGVRPLGKGKMITMGSPMPHVPTGWTELLKWCDVTMPAAPAAPGCRVARFVSNNGLYDVYVLWAEQIKSPGVVTLTVPGNQTTMRDLQNGAMLQGNAVGDRMEFAGLKIEPLETYAFLMPRHSISAAPLDWLKLQRNWWKGTKKPASAPRLKPWTNTLPLDADWAFRSLPAEQKDVTALLGPAVDDRAWDRLDFGVWYGKKYPDTTRGIFRKHFTVPPAWQNNGRTWLWVHGTDPVVYLPPYQTQVYLDGQLVSDSKGQRYASYVQDITERLTPGEHLLTVVAQSRTPVGGVAGNIWLEHVPEPAARQTLNGDWNGAQLPGKITTPPGGIQRCFNPDPAQRDKRALLYVETTQNNIVGIYLNGRLINRDFIGQHFLINLTPYLRWDQPNTLTLNLQYPENPTDVQAVEIRYYGQAP